MAVSLGKFGGTIQTGGAASTTVTLSGSVTAGSVVWVAVGGNTSLIGVTISGGSDSFTSVGAANTSGSGLFLNNQMFYAKNSAGGYSTITVTPALPDNMFVLAVEIIGADTSAPLDGTQVVTTGTGAVSATFPASGNTSAADFVITFLSSNGGNNFSSLLGSTFIVEDGGGFHDQAVGVAQGSAGSVTVTASIAGNWLAMQCAFKPAGGAVTVIRELLLLGVGK